MEIIASTVPVFRFGVVYMKLGLI